MAGQVKDLVHFSARPLLAVRDASPCEPGAFKPNGLWISVGESWLEWCVRESHGLERLRFATPVEIGEAVNVLQLRTAQEIRAFDEKYGYKEQYRSEIAWGLVMQEYDGIIIAPYQWSCRYDLFWYYVWDCASGCILSASAVKRLGEPVGFAVRQAATMEDE